MAEATSSSNPYLPPSAPVFDRRPGEEGDLIENGRRVPTGHGASWLGRAWDIFKAAPVMWILIWLIFVVLILIVNFLPFIGWIINLFMQPMLWGGVMLACRDAEEGKPVEIPTLFQAFGTHAGPLAIFALINLAVYIAVGLIFLIVIGLSVGGMAGLGVFSGGSLPGPEFFVPLMIAGLVAFIPMLIYGVASMLAPALIVLRDITPFDALRMAFVGMAKNVLALLVFFVIALVLAILACVPLLLGWFVLGPVLMCTLYAIYRDVYFA